MESMPLIKKQIIFGIGMSAGIITISIGLLFHADPFALGIASFIVGTLGFLFFGLQYS